MATSKNPDCSFKYWPLLSHQAPSSKKEFFTPIPSAKLLKCIYPRPFSKEEGGYYAPWQYFFNSLNVGICWSALAPVDITFESYEGSLIWN